MKCEEIRERFIENPLAGELLGEAAAHVRSCSGCAEVWGQYQKLFALLDEWKAPEASPFFDTRLHAHVREAKRKDGERRQLLSWLRKPLFGMPAWRPVAAGTLAVTLAIGAGIMQKNNHDRTVAVADKGTAVDDLQALDKHQDEISNLELLDDLNAADNNQVEDEL